MKPTSQPEVLPPIVEGLPFTGPWLLAPMEGVTDPRYRDVVLSRHDGRELGGAFTEFVRVTQVPSREEFLLKHLGPDRFPMPVGLQLMGSDVGLVAESARRAAAVGAPVVDLNFGCPAKGALKGCAGSAMLSDPKSLERLVRACVDAQSDVPVTGKIRAGVTNADRIEDLAKAVEQGGARLLTIHCRTRLEAYCDEVDWTRIRRAVQAVTIPVCGNGSALVHADLERMRAETGCRFVMVGRAALGNPWIFSGTVVSKPEAARFLVEYFDVMAAAGHGPRGCLGRVKQLVRYWTAADLFDEASRTAFLRSEDPPSAMAPLRACCAEAT